MLASRAEPEGWLVDPDFTLDKINIVMCLNLVSFNGLVDRFDENHRGTEPNHPQKQEEGIANCEGVKGTSFRSQSSA